jgi:type I restriction enzyme S subunit
VSKWEMVTLNDVCSLITDGTHQTPQYADKGFIFLSSKNVTTGKIDWENVKYIPEELHNQLYARIAPRIGDVLLAKNGTTGVAAVVDKEFVFDIYVSLAILRPKDSILSEYLLYAINNPITKRKFNKELKGIGVPNLHLKNIRETTIPLPPIKIQKQIAKTLDTAAELLAMRKQQLAELDNLLKATFYDMFGDFDELPTKSLIDLIEPGAGLSYGIVQPGDDVGKGIGVLRPVDITEGRLSLDNIKYIPAGIEEPYKKTRLNGNEILITVRGTTGDTVLTDKGSKGMNVTRGIAVIRQNDKLVNKMFLNAYLKSEKSSRYIQDNTRGATLKQINLSALRELPIPLPSLKLQNQFATIYNNIEIERYLLIKAIESTQYLFNSLLAKYFK